MSLFDFGIPSNEGERVASMSTSEHFEELYTLSQSKVEALEEKVATLTKELEEAQELAERRAHTALKWATKATKLMREVRQQDAELEAAASLELDLLAKVARITSELEEQARLNGMGAERELALLAELGRMRKACSYQTFERAPGHTDLMVSPESIDPWLKENDPAWGNSGGTPTTAKRQLSVDIEQFRL